jgi:protein involved in polysaccharide export with SLBB domain
MKFVYLIFLFLCAFVISTQAQKSTDAENKAVYVVGDVVKPSELKFEEGMTLTQAINKVGGISLKNKRKIARIYRRIAGTKDREIIKVSFKEVEKGKAEDLVLQPYDIIEIQPRKRVKGGDLDLVVKSSFPTYIL